VWLIDIFFSFISLFYHAESSTFSNLYYLFTIRFLSKQTRHGRNIVSFYSFLFISVYRAINVCVDLCNSGCLVIQLESAEVSLYGDQHL